ncbi:amino acid synthesis family protein, partial [Pelagibacteraceae bacterium]|nr:amino acid synthesis family protein [Pelagibacteraceae bacterium]
MTLEIRKMCKFVDTTYCEEPVELISVAAVITNPWVDQGYVEDLKPAILDIAPKLGDFLVAELL